MSNLIRWVLFFPTAVVAYLGVHWVVGMIASLEVHFGWVDFTLAANFDPITNSAVSSYIFVLVGALVAPPRTLTVAFTLAALEGLGGTILVTIGAIQGKSADPVWVLVLSVVASAIGIFLAITQVVRICKLWDSKTATAIRTLYPALGVIYAVGLIGCAFVLIYYEWIVVQPGLDVWSTEGPLSEVKAIALTLLNPIFVMLFILTFMSRTARTTMDGESS
jgi:hypothetical protein